MEFSGESPWQFARRDLAATGAIESKTFDGKLDIVWQSDFAEKAQAPLTYSQGVIVYPGSKKRIFLIDPVTGEVRKKIRFRSSPQAGGLLIDSLLYTATAPPFNQVDCVRVRDGKRIWRSLILNVSAPLVADSNLLFIAGGDNVVYCLDRISGDLKWESQMKESIVGAPLIAKTDGATSVIVSLRNGNSVALSIDSGSTTPWSLTARESFAAGTAIFAEDNSIVWPSLDGNCWFATLASSTDLKSTSVQSRNIQLAKSERSAIWGAPAISYTRCVVSSNSGEVALFIVTDPSDLEQSTEGKVDRRSKEITKSWTTQLPGAITASPIIVGEYVVVGLLNRWIYTLKLSTGEIVASRELDGAIKQPPISDGKWIYVATETAGLYCLGPAPTVTAPEAVR